MSPIPTKSVCLKPIVELNFHPFRLEEINDILKNSDDYLYSANVACSYVQRSLEKGKPLDIIVHNDTAASSAIATICERIQGENEAMIKDIDLLLKDVKRRNGPTPKQKFSFDFYIVAGALLGIILTGVLLLRRNLLE